MTVRIGILFEYTVLNGGERSILAMLDQRPPDLDVVAITPAVDSTSQPNPLFQELEQRDISRSGFQWERGERRSLDAASLRGLCQQHEIDVLHANSLSMGRKLGRIADQLPCPTTTHLRDILKLNKTAIADLNRHALRIAVSQATRMFHLAQGVSATGTITLHNGLDVVQFAPRPKTGWLNQQLGLPVTTPLAATIGQICLRKGQTDLAMAATLLRNPDVHFLLIGERHSQKAESVAFDEAIDTIFAEAGMSPRLHRLGFIADMANVYPELDLVIHPARQEPLGRVLLEAASCGIPIIATAVGGTCEILTNECTACLVPQQDPQKLAVAIDRLLSDPAEGQRLATQARQDIVDKFDVINQARDFWEQMRNVSEGDQPSMSQRSGQLGGIVLCGGQSSRMGTAKHSLEYQGQTFLQGIVSTLQRVVSPVIVVAAADDQLPELPPNVCVVRDAMPFQGPLAGLVTGLKSLPTAKLGAFVTACDTPLLSPEVVAAMCRQLVTGSADIVLARDAERSYPLTAVYHRETIDVAEQLLQQGIRKLSALQAHVAVEEFPPDQLRQIDPGFRSLRNINTQADYDALLREVR